MNPEHQKYRFSQFTRIVIFAQKHNEMKKLPLILLLLSFLLSYSCGNASQYQDGTFVKIETDFGDMIVKLYDETPLHRDNFIKLITDGYYDDLLFHRIVKEFMIQGGDPDSRNARAGQALGSGDPGYTIPAEFNTKLFHKKGALAAARAGDDENPEKQSSGSQFYIVQGKVYTEDLLDKLEQQKNSRKAQAINRNYVNQYQQELNELNKAGELDSLNARIAEIKEEIQKEIINMETYNIDDEKRKIYSTLGGTPSLDMDYTVFGEVIEGLDVIDKIVEVETNQSNRPKTDIKMKITILK